MHYLELSQIEEVRRLRLEEGLLIKVIAQQFNICEATVSKIVNHKTGARKRKRVGYERHRYYDPQAFMEEDFSLLPDTVLFQHVREHNFLG